MKTNSLTRIKAGLAALLITPAYAIEAPADDAPPPPAVEVKPAGQAPDGNAVKPAPKADAAYLGVVTSSVPQMLAKHLGLKQGEGIIIGAVMPDGPAAKAGIAEHDIITRIGDKAVSSPQDLSEQVQAHKPGETIRFDLIQKGKPTGVDVTLGTRPAQFAEMNHQPLDQLNLDGMPKEFEDRIRGMIQGNIGGLKLDIQDGTVEIAPQIGEAMRQLKLRMDNNEEALQGPQNALKGQLGIEQGATFRLLDENGSVELKSNDGSKEVTIRDKEEKITWSGPWDTEQDKAAAPEDIRQRVERLNLDTQFQGNGLRFRMGGPIQPDDGGE